MPLVLFRVSVDDNLGHSAQKVAYLLVSPKESSLEQIRMYAGLRAHIGKQLETISQKLSCYATWHVFLSDEGTELAVPVCILKIYQFSAHVGRSIGCREASSVSEA